MIDRIASDPAALLVVAFAVAALAGVLGAAGLRRWWVRRALKRADAGPREAGEPSPAQTPTERFRRGLGKSRAALAGRIGAALGRGATTDETLVELERVLLESDVGVKATERLLRSVSALPAGQRSPEAVRATLRREVSELVAADPLAEDPPTRPWVVLVVGVNGVGKTTTIGKLAARHRACGRSVLVIAGDTFRAAAIEQLAVWAERSGAQVVRQVQGADPSAVVFDGMKAAVARSFDVVLIDTAGRLHTKVNLMEELRKVHRVVERVLPGAPHEVLLVVDATTGQNAVSQARTFGEAVAVTGVVLTKLDGSARGGVVVAIRHELGLRVRYVGLGEGIDDLQPFDADEFAAALVSDGGA
jgi:fused signal recognition particle receptor